MSRGWRYIAQRLDGSGASGNLIDLDLPLEDVQINNILSGHGGLSATISPAYSRLLGPDGLPILTEWATAIYAENDGDIRGAGILTSAPVDGETLSLECTSWTGYALDMPYTAAWYGVEIDPLDIVRHIWQHLQTQGRGNIGLEVSPLKTGKKIGTKLKQRNFDTRNGPVEFESGPYRLAWYQDHDLASNIDNLAEETPFDYVERHFWDGDQIKHKLDFGFPKIGRNREDLRFVFGENIHTLPTIERDGTEWATEAMVLGSGEGARMIRGEAFYANPPGVRRVAVVSDSSLRSTRAAFARANQEMQWRKSLDSITQIVVRDTPSAPLGAVGLGDTIVLSGRASEWREIDTKVRVLEIGFQPDSNNEAVYTVARTDRVTS